MFIFFSYVYITLYKLLLYDKHLNQYINMFITHIFNFNSTSIQIRIRRKVILSVSSIIGLHCQFTIDKSHYDS